MNLKIWGIYILVCLIWGTTWFSIKFQLGYVPPQISVMYRFVLASFILFLYCVISKKKMFFSLKEHIRMCSMGIFLFAIHYWFIYDAEKFLTSGMAAMMSTSSIYFNILFGRIFLKKRVKVELILGGIIGIMGLGLIFSNEIKTNHGVSGLLSGILGSIFASFGCILSESNQRKGIPVIQGNAYGMLYAVLFTFVITQYAKIPLIFSFNKEYIISLLHLCIFGSVLAFGSYLYLVGKIGADRASYATLIYPVIALSISSFWENFHWSLNTYLGILLIIFGKIVSLKTIFNRINYIKKAIFERIVAILFLQNRKS